MDEMQKLFYIKENISGIWDNEDFSIVLNVSADHEINLFTFTEKNNYPKTGSVGKFFIEKEDYYYVLRFIFLKDNDAVNEIKFKLEDLGYEVCGMAVNGADAIKLAYDTEPDLVLMDITLKGEMNGIKAAKSILNENIPLIFLTSHTDESTVKEANMVPSYGFLN